MEFDQWVRLVGAIGAVATVGVTVVVTVYKGLDRRSNGHKRAEEALSLLKSWDEIELGDEDARDVRARKSHREELLRRAFSATQTYLYATEPTLISHWQTFLIGATGAFVTLWLLLGPNSSDSFVVAAFCVAVATCVAVPFIFSRVDFYKTDASGLRKAGSRADSRRRAKAKQNRMRGSTPPIAAEDRR